MLIDSTLSNNLSQIAGIARIISPNAVLFSQVYAQVPMEGAPVWPDEYADCVLE